MLQKECDESTKYIEIPLCQGGTRIPLLSFADDTVILAHANLTACNKIKSILRDYCATSGQKINYNKSEF